MGVLEDARRRVAAALDPVAPERVLALGGEADVGHDRDAASGQQLDLGRHLAASLELDAVGTAFLHEADGGVVGLLGGALVGPEGEVADDE